MAANILRKLTNKPPMWLLKFWVNHWPPYWGAGIKIIEATPDYKYIKVCLKSTWYNKNYVGTQFGGSIYAMTDPFYMLMIMSRLGPDYIVWDKAAQINFLKPGKTQLIAEFQINDLLIEEIKKQTLLNKKYVFDLPVEIKDATGLVVAKVIKNLYVRKKD